MRLCFDVLKLWLWVLALQIALPLAAVLLTFVVIADIFPRKVIRNPHEPV